MTTHDIGVVMGVIALLALGLTALIAAYDLLAWLVGRVRR